MNTVMNPRVASDSGQPSSVCRPGNVEPSAKRSSLVDWLLLGCLFTMYLYQSMEIRLVKRLAVS